MPLTIESVETIPIRVPLPFTYKGSYYKMRNRCTIITRIRTSEGIVGEAYNADEDEPLQSEIRSILHDELVPAGGRAGRLRHRAGLGGDAPGDLRPAPAALVRDAGDGLHRHRRLGRRRQGDGPAALADLGRLPRPDPDDRHRRLLHPRRRVLQGPGDRARDRLLPVRARHGRDEVQDRRRGARGRRGAAGPGAPSCRRRLPVRRRRQPGLHGPRGPRLPGGRPRRGHRHPLVRGADPLARRLPRPARRAPPGQRRRRGRPERDQPGRHARDDGRGGDRRLQLRRVLGRRTHRVAAGRGPAPRPSTSSSATTRRPRWPRTCSRRSRTARTWRRSRRRAIRSSGR